MHRLSTIATALLLVFLTSCVARVDSYAVPGESLDRQATFYLAISESDSQYLHRILQDLLVARGLRVSSGPATRKPPDAKYRIEYFAQWKKDVNWYLLEFEFRIYESSSGLIVASARSYRSSLRSRADEDVVREAVDRIVPPASSPLVDVQE